jgi:hypothetical protein
MLKFWFILFVSAHDGSAGLGAPSLVAGPFLTANLCYAAAALGIDRMAREHADKDFRGACVNDADILPIQDLADRAGAPARPK